MDNFLSHLPNIINSLFNNAVAGGLLVYWLTTYSEQKRQKVYIFKTLMANRATPLSIDRVNALNLIDVEFYGNETVISSLNIYFDHLNRSSRPTLDPNWSNREQELFAELLFTMGKSIGYKFDKVRLRNSTYSPIAHGEWQANSDSIQKGLLSIIKGDSEILVKIKSD